MTDLTQFEAIDIRGQKVALSRYAGQVALVVNTASKCGFTPQYEGLQKLQDDYGPRGFTVLGFPCNQFAGQEPGSADEIAGFCETRFSASFPLFDKIEVNGAGTHPLYAWLKDAAPGLLGSKAIKWNFTKFLIDRRGQPVHRYAPATKPVAIAGDIEKLLG